MLDILIPYESIVVSYEHKTTTKEYDIEHIIKADIIFPGFTNSTYLYYSYMGSQELSPNPEHISFSLTGPKTTYYVGAKYIAEHYTAMTFPTILEYALPKFYEQMFHNNIEYDYIQHGRFNKSYISVKLLTKRIMIPITLKRQNAKFRDLAQAVDLILFYRPDPKVKEAALKIAQDLTEESMHGLIFDTPLSKYQKEE